ncbi:putative dehydrogenase [Microbacterium natoriense]|uniref:Dehydrogenase n=1 Tax=Microbacterium natoriense TaxID=284570 RepID=A0AAW8EWC6_9MICO|nr:Gfo/Idh/MocA family oxidoreductase [Microbacterium natoriense]MDQ0647775.1 putative dehydrogenase [Microbacterium natoriense]
MSVPRIALVGAGTMGSYHARVVAASGRAKLARIIDSRRSVGEAVAARFGTAWTPELGDLADVDAVIIAASTEAHDALARAVLDAGKPLLVEKPVVNGLAKTREILELSEQAGVPILCGLLERYNPAVLTAKHFVNSPVHVTATRHSPYAPRIRTGVAWDLLIHDVDLAINVLGSIPSKVDGSVGYFHPDSVEGAEDVATASLSFAGGQLAQLSASRIGQRKDRTLLIHELDRLIEVDLLRRTVTVYRHVSGDADEDGRGYRQQTSIEIPEITNSREPLAAQFDHFVDLLDGIADPDEERRSILPSHAVIDTLLSLRDS